MGGEHNKARATKRQKSSPAQMTNFLPCSPSGPAFCGTRNVTVGSWTIAQFPGWKNCSHCTLRGPSLNVLLHAQQATCRCNMSDLHAAFGSLCVCFLWLKPLLSEFIKSWTWCGSHCKHVLEKCLPFVAFCISCQAPVVWTVTVWSRYGVVSLL